MLIDAKTAHNHALALHWAGAVLRLVQHFLHPWRLTGAHAIEQPRARTQSLRFWQVHAPRAARQELPADVRNSHRGQRVDEHDAAIAAAPRKDGCCRSPSRACAKELAASSRTSSTTTANEKRTSTSQRRTLDGTPMLACFARTRRHSSLQDEYQSKPPPSAPGGSAHPEHTRGSSG